MNTPTLPANVRLRAVFQLWAANLLLGALVGSNYLAHLPEAGSLKVWLFAVPALLSSVLTLTLVPAALFLLAARCLRSVHTLGTLQAAFWAVFHTLLFADTRIYNVFHYHFNGQVLNLVYTRGSEDAIHLGWQVWSAVVLGLGAVIALESWLWKRAVTSALTAHRSPRGAGLLRPALAWTAFLAPLVFLEKTIYASAHLGRDHEITRLARLFPLYAPVPMDELATRVLGVESPTPEPLELKGLGLRYPLEAPHLDPAGPRPNVLVLVVDCLRRDMLDPAVTPNLQAWADAGCRRFDNHVSGGNSTRYGLFSLLYGLHGSYWFPFLAARRGPVLIDTLLEQGYEFGVFGSASMNFPELRDTAWASIPDAVHDDFDHPEAWGRDVQAGRALIQWLGQHADSGRPFFGFLLLDSPHQTYSFPPGGERFRPAAPDLDYMEMTRNEGPSPEALSAVWNRYKNAVFHADAVLGEVLAAIDGSPSGKDTWVVVTGDHGEEFLECGFFGHTSAFTPQQLEVPLLMRGPGIVNGIETRPTSHLDFAPTLLESMGAAASMRAGWCLGENLLAPLPSRARVVAGWNQVGVWGAEAILSVPLSPLAFDIEVYDYSWNEVEDDLSILQAERETLERLGAECNRFLQR